MASNNFLFNLQWREFIAEYPAELRLEVYEAAMEYAASGTLPELSSTAKLVMKFICREIDYNREQYESTVERRKAAGRRSGEVRRQRKLEAEKEAKEEAEEVEIEGVEAAEQSPEDAELEQQFEEFRKEYPGTKRNLESELADFKSAFPTTWRQYVPLLLPAAQKLNEYYRQCNAKKKFAPNPRNLKAWLSDQCWTYEYPDLTPPMPRRHTDADYESCLTFR